MLRKNVIAFQSVMELIFLTMFYKLFMHFKSYSYILGTNITKTLNIVFHTL